MSGGEWVLFALLAALTLALVYISGDRARSAESVAQRAVAVTLPEGVDPGLIAGHDWLANGQLIEVSGTLPEGWQVVGATERAGDLTWEGEDWRLECDEAPCLGALTQRAEDLRAGPHLLQADVYLDPICAGQGLSARVGYDATGGMDLAGESVTWSLRQMAGGWQRANLVVEEDGGPATVFVALDAFAAGCDARVRAVRLLGPEPLESDTLALASPRPAAVQQMELRAVYWSTLSGSPAEPAEVDALMTQVAGARFNAVFVQAAAEGMAGFDTALMPRHPAVSGEDPVGAVVTAARERGLAAYAWVDVLRVWPEARPRDEAPDGHLARGDSPALGSLLAQPYQGYWIASPADGNVRTRAGALVAELVQRYQLDGVVLTGLGLPEVGGPAQAEPVAGLLREVMAAGRAARPGLVILVGEAATGPALPTKGDWPADARADGLLSAHRPQDTAWGRPVSARWALGEVLVQGRTWAEVEADVYAARRAGAVGVGVMDVEALSRVGYWGALAAGPFRSPADRPPLGQR